MWSCWLKCGQNFIRWSKTTFWINMWIFEAFGQVSQVSKQHNKLFLCHDFKSQGVINNIKKTLTQQLLLKLLMAPLSHFFEQSKRHENVYAACANKKVAYCVWWLLFMNTMQHWDVWIQIKRNGFRQWTSVNYLTPLNMFIYISSIFNSTVAAFVGHSQCSSISPETEFLSVSQAASSQLTCLWRTVWGWMALILICGQAAHRVN